MPTLLTPASAAKAPRAMLGSPTRSSSAGCEGGTSPSPTITLSFGGVDFCLQPSSSSSSETDSNNGEVLYKCNTSESICLSLKSFTGSLLVSKKTGKVSFLPAVSAVDDHPTAARTTRTTFNVPAMTESAGNTATNTNLATVEEEPDSPEAAKGIKKVSPGQQKLPFAKNNSNAKNGTGKTTLKKPKKRKNHQTKAKKNVRKRKNTTNNSSADILEDEQDKDKTPKTSTTSKRSRLCVYESDDNTANNGIVSFMLGQEPEPTQELTQQSQTQIDVPDLSQTMNDSVMTTTTTTTTDTDKSIEKKENGLDDDMMMKRSTTTITNHHQNTRSVQEILDQVNGSTNDSVASIRDVDHTNDDEDDDDVATHMEENNDNDNDDAEKETEKENKNLSQVKEDISTNDTLLQQEQDVSMNDDVVADDDFAGYPPPAARWGHTMTKVQNDQILIYGGQSYDVEGNPIILSDVHVYDPKKKTWDKPINCRGEARQWHTATYIPGRQQIIAFGGETLDLISTGKNKNKVVTSDTLRVLDTEIMLWYPPAASGDIPTGRSGHTATWFPETNELVLFGGVRGSKWLNAVSVLDITRWIWTTPKVEGSPPKPRSYHSSTLVGKNKMVVFGGNNKSACFNSVHVLEMINHTVGNGSDEKVNYSWKWSNPTVQGKAPFPRTGHSATLLEDGKTICIYGGWDPNDEEEQSIFKGSYLLDTKEWTWKEGPKVIPGGSGSLNHTVQDCGPKRCGHAAALNSSNGEIFVFGGRIPGEALAGDVQLLALPKEQAIQLDK